MEGTLLTRALLAALLALGLAGCGRPAVDRLVLEDEEIEAAIDPEATRHASVMPEITHGEDAPRAIAGAAAAPVATGKAGDPVYSTSYAIDLARLTLKAAGFDPEDRAVQVSFFEGVYTVTFPRPEDQAKGQDFSVDIAEKDSRVLKVVTQQE